MLQFLRLAAVWSAGYTACALVCAAPCFVGLHRDPSIYVIGPGFRFPDASLDLFDQIILSLVGGAIVAIPLFLLIGILWLCIPRYRRDIIASRILPPRPKDSVSHVSYDY